MESEASVSFSAASLVEDVLQQHGHRLKDLDLEYRKAEEAGRLLFLYLFILVDFTEFQLKFVSSNKVM